MLAAASQARAEVILTFNLKDFPADDALEPWGVKAQHPQDYLLTLYEMDAPQVVRRIGTIAAERARDEVKFCSISERRVLPFQCAFSMISTSVDCC